MARISSENNPQTDYIAFFDLDQTLINANSGMLLAEYAYKKKLMKWADLLRAMRISILYRLNLRNTEKILEDLVKWIEGVPEKTLKDLSASIFEERLINAVTDEARTEILFHKAQNAGTVILSSALYPICQAVADYLQMDDFICTELEVKDGLFTGRTSGKLCFGNEKALRLMEYCERNNTNAANCWYYSDSLSDLPVLNSVGHPVCVNPDKKLKQLAGENKWQIRYWI